MNKISDKDKALIFAAIKMVEQLFQDEKVSSTVLRRVIDEYSNIIDTSQFSCARKKIDN